MKPHKGTILGVRIDIDIPNIKKEPYGANLGYIVQGRWINHPQFGMSIGRTSLIVKKSHWTKEDEHGYQSCEVETLNSRYTWKRLND